MKRTPLKRKSPLRTKKGFRQGARELSESFRTAIVDGRCIMAGRSGGCIGRLDPCHIVSKSALRSRGLSEDVVYDSRNGVCACRRHHRRNDNGIERFPLALLPQSLFDFAAEHGLTHIIESYYPETVA